MSIAAIGAGVSTLFNMIQGLSAPTATQTPATPAPATTEQPKVHAHGQLRQKIQDAVIGALQDPANAGADPNTVIQTAISNVLKGNDLSPLPAGEDPAAQKATFDALLKANGVDASQFQADFQAAMADAKNSNGGSIDFGKIFQTFPKGSSLDVVA